MLLAIDPDIRELGIAVFKDQYLAVADSIINPCRGRGPKAWVEMAYQVDLWVQRHCANALVDVAIEVPNRHFRGRIDDIFQVVGVAGAVSHVFRFRNITHYSPSEWKGSVPKKIHNERVLKKLSNLERSKFTAQTSDSIDAVGIGLFHLRRSNG